MFYNILLIVYLSLFAILSWKKPRWSIFIILAALPSYAIRFNIVNVPMTVLEGMILSLFFIWAARKINFKEHNVNNDFKHSLNFKFLVKSAGRQISNFKKNLKSKTISNIKIAFPVILFLLAATISIFISPNKTAALGIWKAYFIEPILFLIVFIDIFRKNIDGFIVSDDERDNVAETICKINTFRFFASALSIPALYISILAIYQKFTGFLVPVEYWQPNYHRVTSFFSYPNAIGLLLAPIIIILLGAAILPFFFPATIETRLTCLRRQVASLQQRIYFFTTAILAIAAVIFAKSEGAIIALLASVFIFIFLLPARRDGTRLVSATPQKIKKIALIIIILASSISVGVYFKYGRKWNELFAKTNLFELDRACVQIPPSLRGERGENFCKIYQKITLQDLSGTLRRQIWKETFTMLKSRPILGAGLAGYQKTIKPYHTKDYIEIYLYPHNIILNFWSEIGLLGLAAFIWLIILFFIFAFPLICHHHQNFGVVVYKNGLGAVSIILLTSMSVLLIHGLVDVPYFKNDLAILFWIIWGMVHTLSARSP